MTGPVLPLPEALGLGRAGWPTQWPNGVALCPRLRATCLDESLSRPERRPRSCCEVTLVTPSALHNEKGTTGWLPPFVESAASRLCAWVAGWPSWRGWPRAWTTEPSQRQRPTCKSGARRCHGIRYLPRSKPDRGKTGRRSRPSLVRGCVLAKWRWPVSSPCRTRHMPSAPSGQTQPVPCTCRELTRPVILCNTGVPCTAGRGLWRAPSCLCWARLASVEAVGRQKMAVEPWTRLASPGNRLKARLSWLLPR